MNCYLIKIINLLKNMKYYLLKLNIFKKMLRSLNYFELIKIIKNLFKTIVIKCNTVIHNMYLLYKLPSTNLLKYLKLYLLKLNIFKIMPTQVNYFKFIKKMKNMFKTIKNTFKIIKNIFTITVVKCKSFVHNICFLLYMIPSIYINFLKYTTIVLLIAFICFLMSLVCLWIWANWGPIFLKGDPIVCPHYKKTYYYEDANYCYYDFYPYLNKMKQNLKNNPTKAYYKWVYYYDWNDNTYFKAEFFCVYKIGTQRSVWVFETDDIWYIDKTQRIHYIPNLIECRIEENWMMGQYFEKFDPKLFDKKNIIKRVYNEEGLVLGYNINIGEIRYEFQIGDYTPNPKWQI